MANYADLAHGLEASLHLAAPPIAICMADTVHDAIPANSETVPAGCVFWERAASGRSLATSAEDHRLCAVGAHTHRFVEHGTSSEAELRTALSAMIDLGYLRDREIPAIPVLQRATKHVIYAPLADTPLPPDVVMLFADSAQSLVIAEAVQRVDDAFAPAMGRPACAVVAQAANSGRATLSLGCCGARAYLESLSDAVALWALPGGKIEQYCAEIVTFASGNTTLGAFHRLRKHDIASGKTPSYAASLQRLQERTAT